VVRHIEQWARFERQRLAPGSALRTFRQFSDDALSGGVSGVGVVMRTDGASGEAGAALSTQSAMSYKTRTARTSSSDLKQ